MMPLHSRLHRADTAMSQTPPPRPRTGRRLSLQPQPTLQPSLSPPSGRLRRSPSPTPPRARTAASTPTKAPTKLGYKILMLGSAKVGKTSIIQRFLYDSYCPKYKRTIEELHRADFPIGGTTLTLDILDTGGAYEFPAMKTLNIVSDQEYIEFQLCCVVIIKIKLIPIFFFFHIANKWFQASSNAFILVYSVEDDASFDEVLDF